MNPLRRIKTRLQRIRKKAWGRCVLLTRRFSANLRVTDSVLTIMSFVGALGFIVCMILDIGFNEGEIDRGKLESFIRVVRVIFVLNILGNLLTHIRTYFTELKRGMIILDILVFSTLIPLIYPKPAHPWIPVLEKILYSDLYLYMILGAYSVVSISYGIMRMIGKRTNPSLMLSGSFIVFIILGSLILMLPRCTTSGITFTNALFVSTSAVCITGLTPVDIPATFTPMGLAVLSLLIQIGGLGVLTFTSFFALFFTGRSSIFNQLMLKDMIYSKSMATLVPSLIYTLLFTLTVEVIGAVAVFFSIHNTLGLTLREELFFSGFHSLSAFCNAGFSNLSQGLSNPNLVYGNQWIYWVVSVLVVSGSIGFPILVNFKEAIGSALRRRWMRLRGLNPGNRTVHYYSMNSKIVLATFSLLFLFGAVFFFLAEYDNTLAGMTIWQKVSQSVFNSVVPRSAGFSSVNPADFLSGTLLVIMFLMWVGGGSQSTGGGIKVNTFAAIMLNLRAIILGKGRVTAFRRTVSSSSLRRANAVVALSILTYLMFSVVIVMSEPRLPTRDLLFETLSALFTVGSSLGVTPYLSDTSKVVLCCAMFLGRIGMISLLIGIKGRDTDNRTHYPEDSIIIT